MRPFTEGDRATLEALYRACRLEALWLPIAARARSHFSRDTRGERIHVAVGPAGEPDGFISAWEPDAFIHHLYVRSAVRGRGVGGMLLDSLSGHVARPWRLKCLRSNTRALAFYLKRHWKEVSSGEGDEGPYALLETHET